MENVIKVKYLSTKFLEDGRILGFLAPTLIADELGGVVKGSGNKQKVVTILGKDHCIGVGSFPACFIKSSNKGVGRSGKQLKLGDVFTHVSYDGTESLTITHYTKEQVLDSVMGCSTKRNWSL